MGVVYGCGSEYKAGLWGGLPVPETNFEKLGPMIVPLVGSRWAPGPWKPHDVALFSRSIRA